MHNTQLYYEFELLCPHCENEYLHHNQVEIFERKEDATEGLHIIVSEKDMNVDWCLTRNPSSRRNGLIIHFECENCHRCSELSFAQHKGVTLVRMTGEDHHA